MITCWSAKLIFSLSLSLSLSLNLSGVSIQNNNFLKKKKFWLPQSLVQRTLLCSGRHQSEFRVVLLGQIESSVSFPFVLSRHEKGPRPSTDLQIGPPAQGREDL